jgi:hypothetical protein
LITGTFNSGAGPDVAASLLLSHVSGENLYPETQNPNSDFAACGAQGFAFHRKKRVAPW